MPVMASEGQGPVMVRVLLTDTDFHSVYHPSVTVFYDEKEYTWTEEQLKKTGETIHIPEQKEGIQILSIERQQGNPVYRGTLDIQWKSEGLILVNKLPLEEYLCSVVPGEMPASYEGEALKAQAVCARTSARKQIQQ